MKIITLNKNAFFKVCKEVIQKIEDKPNLVVGVLNGGGYMYSAIKEVEGFKKLGFHDIKLQEIKSSKKYKNFFKPVLKILPYTILNRLRVCESDRSRRAINNIRIDELKNQKIDFDFDSILKKPIKRILIVDDAIDTGITMFVVKNNIRKLFPDAEIKVAVISWTIEESIVTPDYYLYKNTLVRYPWSIDYKERGF